MVSLFEQIDFILQETEMLFQAMLVLLCSVIYGFVSEVAKVAMARRALERPLASLTRRVPSMVKLIRLQVIDFPT